MDKFNPLNMMADLVAAATPQQIRQLAVCAALPVTRPARYRPSYQGRNFREGLTVLEYWLHLRCPQRPGGCTAYGGTRLPYPPPCRRCAGFDLYARMTAML